MTITKTNYVRSSLEIVSQKEVMLKVDNYHIVEKINQCFQPGIYYIDQTNEFSFATLQNYKVDF